MVKKKRQSDAHDNDSSTDSEENGAMAGSASGGCQHVKKSVDAGKLRKQLKATGLAVDCALCTKGGSGAAAASPAESPSSESGAGFEYDSTLWLCFKCGTQLCGRSRNQHALQHYKTPHSDSHALTLNTRTFEIWCYDCDSEVSANTSKSLLECVEFVKKLAQKPPPPTTAPVNNIEQKILATLETLRPLVPLINDNDAGSGAISNKALPLPPPPPPLPIPGMAKRVGQGDSVASSFYNPPAAAAATTTTAVPVKSGYVMQLAPSSPQPTEHLPRVRGLTNLGNTCFFNAVMQCLAQTPYLLEVLKELSEPGEQFTLPGGTFKFKDDEDVELPMIKGTLSSWGGLTAALANTLEELQLGGGVFTPGKLFDKLCTKNPQFRGGDQHDSHELLRHLLESVRSEDLKRYQRVILQNLGYANQDTNSVSEELRQKCKIYGGQASDRILRPDQVFRGFLVSTLTCQDCYNCSSRHEYFLDLSLPVSVEKPQPPQRRKTSPDNAPPASTFSCSLSPPTGPTKAQQKREKEKERKAKRSAKHQNKKMAQKVAFDGLPGDGGDGEYSRVFGCATQEEAAAASAMSSATSSSEQSDADVEDNLIDDNAGVTKTRSAPPPTKFFDANGNDQPLSPLPPPTEKCGDSPENVDKDSIDEDENDSGIATSPANNGSIFPTSAETSGGDGSSAATMNSSLVAVGLSEKGATLVRHLSLGEDIGGSVAATEATVTFAKGDAATTAVPPLTNGEATRDEAALAEKLNELELNAQQKAARMRAKRVRTQSHSDWSTTIAPRYHCKDNECSVQSCLNNFTGVELMTGNNKVGCDNCTRHINQDDPKAKTVNTNATKQFLVSSPPAVLILHLKRFQLGLRCNFRKLTLAVSFPMILDIAPFCGSKVKNLPNINRRQKKLLYALYGVVEHSGGMYGGHYTAYVKVRPKLAADDKRWSFIPQGSKAELDQDDEQRKKLDELLAKEKARELRLKAANDSDDFSNSSSGSACSSEPEEASQPADAEAGAVGGDEEAVNVQVPLGKWYYVSDTHVREVSEDAVLKSQAYLLFYERIY